MPYIKMALPSIPRLLSFYQDGMLKWLNAFSTSIKVLWPPHAKSWFIGKDPNGGRDWGQEEKGTTEDEMAGWHHWFNGRESQWTLGIGDGQGGLACCDSWGGKESDTTERLIWWKNNKIRGLTLTSDSLLLLLSHFSCVWLCATP